ncbi:5-bromo-4-chloroindolyl phosphate hydrolysis family protein [Clostridium sp. BL-8]|uniref:5-bromo-4-chloroindolyl phosphate hydrolysis family protein n=1 Tax=Clostridium sp. BL-8 TaxID=349938 RepID=UPI00098CBF24|nr:5-bromo-4-chloroindolyl phosphate hydrolysis family protein [Clostridium sp. BL-8]OOM73950.1 5-bromo-4-chloroindolyl phosphate hydrolysis protein [Clostridium sp. BL-8]
MGRKDFSNLEDQIRDTVKNAFDAIDFAGIKKDINDKTESTINEVKIKIKDKSHHLNKKLKYKVNDNYEEFNNITIKDKKTKDMYIAKRPVGSISGILYTVFGAIGSGTLGILLIVYSILTSIMVGFATFNYVSLGIMVAFFSASVVLTLRGRYLRKRVKRFKEYVTCLGGKYYCSIEELAESIRMKNKFVVKDLKKMIELDMFPQAHIDDEQTYFMLNNETYENYLNAQKALKEREEEELRRENELKEEINDPAKKALRDTIEIGKNYIEEIGNVSDCIQEKEVSEKLNKLKNIVSQIFRNIEHNPRKLTEVNKFINHYLPMTLKLVNAYKELTEQTVQGDNIKNAKSEIEKAIDSINTAFEKLLDDLFEEIALDISTDISVLETLFTQEGLTKKDFEKE